jgi:hypothetical protein
MLSHSFTAEALEALADGASAGDAPGQVAPGVDQQLGHLQLGPDTPEPGSAPANHSSSSSSSGSGGQALSADSGANSMGHYSSSRRVLVRTNSAPTPAQLTTSSGSGQGGHSSGRTPPAGSPPHSTMGSASSPQQQPAVTTSRLTRAGSLTRSGSLNNRKVAPNRVCCNALLAAYARAAPPQWSKAVALLEGMGECGGELCPDIVSWNTVIKAVGNAGQTDRAFQVRTAGHGMTA